MCLSVKVFLRKILEKRLPSFSADGVQRYVKLRLLTCFRGRFSTKHSARELGRIVRTRFADGVLRIRANVSRARWSFHFRRSDRFKWYTKPASLGPWGFCAVRVELERYRAVEIHIALGARGDAATDLSFGVAR